MNRTIDPERWERIQRILFDALDRPPQQRTTFLDDACGDDVELRAEVDSLIAAHEQQDGLAREPARETLPAERIGPYRLERRLGAGGMGTVYLALREGADFEQTVALKLIRAGFGDPALDERLRTERRILARLEHPGIARFVDGGVTPWGQPFYAMEYVDGVGLLVYCDRERLTLRERLRLFLRVCDAVQHAHQQLVVHRDLKPGNILVTHDGQPKLLDFGIAKLVDPETRDATHTAPWVTPAYASPEQVRGEPVGTASDVYALGVLLYEMLAGCRPYAVEDRPPAEVQRIICEETPQRPSVRALAGPAANAVLDARRTSADRFRRDLAGDLDTIVLKALAKEPVRRYPSAQALADDLRRYLDGRPVLALPDTLRYRAGKFVQRHRTVVTVSALGVIALLTGTALAAWQARMATVQARLAAQERDRATDESEKAQLVAGLMVDLFRLSDPTETLGDTITAREMLDRGSARIEREFGDQPDIQARLLVEVARVYVNLGLLSRALPLVERSAALRDSLHGAHSPQLAESLVPLAQILAALGRTDEAIERFRRALAIREALAHAPDSIVASTRTELAWLLRARGSYAEAEQLFQQALAAQRVLFGEGAPQLAPALLGLATAYHDGGRFDEAEATFQRALADADTARPHPMAATAMLNIGALRRLREEYASAEPLLHSAFRMRRALYDAGHLDVLEAATEWGRELADLGRYEEAAAVLSEALADARRVLSPGHSRTASLRQSLASVLSELGDYTDASAHFDTVLASKRERYGGDHADLLFAMLQSAEPFLDGASPGRAAQRLAEARAMARRMGGGGGTSGMLALRGEALAALERGAPAEALRAIDASLAIADSTLRPDHRYTRTALRVKGQILLDLDRRAEARALLDSVASLDARVLPAPHPRIGATLLRLAEAQLATGDLAAAERAANDALAHLNKLPPTHWRIGAARSVLGAALSAQSRTSDGRQLLLEGQRIVSEHLGDGAREARRARARAGG